MERYKEIERSIIKTFRKTIWRRFTKAVVEYELIQEGDKIMVCISGGKDSFLLAKCIQELQRHAQIHFEARFVCMDPGYAPFNRELIEENAKTLNIPLEIFDSDIYRIVFGIEEGNPCYLCARMRRGHLYNKAQALGCNKIALGHHFDDVIETTLMSMFYGSEIKTMMPKLHSENFEGIELIRPLYLVKEQAILHWRDHNDLTFINCACLFTQETECTTKKTGKRAQMKQLIKDLRKENPNIDLNIFTSTHNVNLDCVQGYRKDGVKHSFLEEYNRE